jgi:hypothetical protein
MMEVRQLFLILMELKDTELDITIKVKSKLFLKKTLKMDGKNQII